MFFRNSAYQVNDAIHPSELSPESAYIGLEHIDDIIDDLEQALSKSSKGTLKAVS